MAFNVSRETMGRFDILVAQTKRWQRAINLISQSTLDEIWHRHIADSAQLFALAPPDARSWADLGAGGGYPGLVIAAMAQEKRPDLTVTLVESDRRKAAFLAETARSMGLGIELCACRIEALGPERVFDVITARALAPLHELLVLARPHLAPGGTMIFPKGKAADAEIARLPAIDQGTIERIASKTDSAATILRWA
jgi:16S rRNA (guanine527-N7)-methyltransferase